MLWCVASLRLCPWKSTEGCRDRRQRGSSGRPWTGGSSPPVSISVPPTVKCASLVQPYSQAMATNCAKNSSAARWTAAVSGGSKNAPLRRTYRRTPATVPSMPRPPDSRSASADEPSAHGPQAISNTASRSADQPALSYPNFYNPKTLCFKRSRGFSINC